MGLLMGPVIIDDNNSGECRKIVSLRYYLNPLKFCVSSIFAHLFFAHLIFAHLVKPYKILLSKKQRKFNEKIEIYRFSE